MRSWKNRTSCSTGEEWKEQRITVFLNNSVWAYFVLEASGDEKNDQLLVICIFNKGAMRLADITAEILIYFDNTLKEK